LEKMKKESHPQGAPMTGAPEYATLENFAPLCIN
jgi:hypothetical protein